MSKSFPASPRLSVRKGSKCCYFESKIMKCLNCWNVKLHMCSGDEFLPTFLLPHGGSCYSQYFFLFWYMGKNLQRGLVQDAEASGSSRDYGTCDFPDAGSWNSSLRCLSVWLSQLLHFAAVCENAMFDMFVVRFLLFIQAPAQQHPDFSWC